jgi:hypothetical protein
MAPYLRPEAGPTEHARGAQEGATAAGRRMVTRSTRAVTQSVTRSTRAVTQSVAIVADVMRSAKVQAVFTSGLMPSRLRRWWWKACDAAWDFLGVTCFLATMVVLAFFAYLLVTAGLSALFG